MADIREIKIPDKPSIWTICKLSIFCTKHSKTKRKFKYEGKVVTMNELANRVQDLALGKFMDVMTLMLKDVPPSKRLELGERAAKARTEVKDEFPNELQNIIEEVAIGKHKQLGAITIKMIKYYGKMWAACNSTGKDSK